MNIKEIIDFPIVDLHLHIDGALSPKKVFELSQKEGINIGTSSLEETEEKMRVSDECKSLNEFLEKFDIPTKIMQKSNTIYELVKDLIKRLKEQRYIYAELRFAPQLHTREGLSQEEVVETVLNAMREANLKYEIKTNLILCLMRGDDNDEENMETIMCAKKFLGRGVVAVDLAGAEAVYNVNNFVKYFDIVKEHNIPFTIHAGEADGPSSIYDTIKIGTRRVGHGVRAYEDVDLVDLIKEKNILLEMCPVSNMRTKAISDINEYPARLYYDAGLNICICTDDMTVQNSTIYDDYVFLMERFGFTREEILSMNERAIKSSFMPEEEKEKYLEILESYR